MGRVAFVELTADLEPLQLQRIVYRAYQASHDGPVTLWLHGVSLRDIEPALDDAVRDLGIGVAGVEYRVDPDLTSAALHANTAAVAVVSSQALRGLLDPERTAVLTVDQALSDRQAQACFCKSCWAAVPERAFALA